jgi:adenylate cyclase
LESHIQKGSAPAAEDIRRQLQRILDSPEFHATQRQREFLKFVVTETIAGRAEEVKGYTIATRVFGRKEDFDQALDPIVSIQAGRLRRALERYYLVAGSRDPIRIDIPKGTYVPTFYEEKGTETDADEGGKKSDVTIDGDSWPTLLIKPLQNLTGDPERDYFGIGLATELAVEIARFQEIRVLLYEREAQEGSVPDSAIRFIVSGSIRKYKMGIKVTVHLTDNGTKQQVWGDTYKSDSETFGLMAFEEEVARVIATKIAGERGVISRTLSIDADRRKPSELKTYEAILRYYQYDWTLDPVNFSSALQALEHAVRIEPECGQLWSMLARLYGNAYSLDVSGFETALEKALAFAEFSFHA